MSFNQQPSEPPPAYENATNGGGASQKQPISSNQQQAQTQNAQAGTNHTLKPGDRDISKEDRPLPPGWLPQYDSVHDRFFFVDTKNPKGPRSIWVHPMDDPEWQRSVPRGMDPLEYINRLWQDQPDSASDSSSQRTSFTQGQQQSQSGPTNFAGIPPILQGHTQDYNDDRGYGQIQDQQYSNQGPGQTQGQGGSQVQTISMKQLVQEELEKMGSPEEYARANPPGKASGLFHHKESPEARQHRHALHRAENRADRICYNSPSYSPYGYGGAYGYPGMGRGYGALYPGYGMGMGYGGLGMGMGGLGMGMGGLGMMGGMGMMGAGFI